MATGRNKLTARALPKLPPGRHWDGGGLYLEVSAKLGQPTALNSDSQGLRPIKLDSQSLRQIAVRLAEAV
jgi:hypothetical protein